MTSLGRPQSMIVEGNIHQKGLAKSPSSSIILRSNDENTNTSSNNSNNSNNNNNNTNVGSNGDEKKVVFEFKAEGELERATWVIAIGSKMIGKRPGSIRLNSKVKSI